jgi:hypothetical protein
MTESFIQTLFLDKTSISKEEFIEKMGSAEGSREIMGWMLRSKLIVAIKE